MAPMIKASRTADILKWVAGSILFCAAFLSFYFLEMNLLVRVGVLVIGVVMALALIAFTTTGACTLSFVKDARQEMRKVAWPSRQETTRATLMVGAMVIVMGLFLWMVDSVLLKIVAWLTGGV